MRVDKLNLLLVIGFFVLFPWRSANAYVDPGTGSYILQILIAGLFGVLFTIKLFWQNIKTFLQGLFLKKEKRAEIEKDQSK